jgi:hypothetical protein
LRNALSVLPPPHRVEIGRNDKVIFARRHVCEKKKQGDSAKPLNRAKLSDAERSFRSRIYQLASGQWFLRGALSNRSSKCGKPNCHCANGELHQSVYLGQGHPGKLRQICIPEPWR